MPDSFAHAREANAHSRQARFSRIRIACNAVTIVADLHHHFLWMACNSNRRRAAAGMTMDVREALLYDPKRHQLKVPRQTREVRRDLESHGNAAQLIASTHLDHTPQYSPDGNRIAFASNRSCSSRFGARTARPIPAAIWPRSLRGAFQPTISLARWDMPYQTPRSGLTPRSFMIG